MKVLKRILKLVSKHKIIAVLFFITLSFSSYFIVKALGSDKTSATRYTIGTVEKGDLITTTSGTGQVYVSDQVDVKAKVGGDVLTVQKEAGDEVKAGDVLFTLDAKDIYKQITSAQISVENARTKLNDLKNPSTLTLLQAQSSLKNAQDNLEKLKLTQVNTYKQAQDTETNAEKTLENSYNSALNTVDSAYSSFATITNDLRTVLFLTDGILPQDITGDPLKDKNLVDMNNVYDVEIPSYWQDIVNSYAFDSESDKATLLDLAKRATAAYKNAKITYDKTVETYRTLSKYSDKSVIEDFLDEAIDTAKTVTEATRNINNLYSYYVDYNNQRKRTIYYNINNYYTTLKTHTNSANSQLSNLISAQNGVNSSKTSLTNAEISLKNLDKNQPIDLAAAEMSLKIQQESYKNTISPDATDIRSAQLNLTQAQQNLEQYQEDLNSCTVTAQFDGVLSNINTEVGATVTVQTSLATLVTKQMIAQLSFNEIDIANIKVGQKATLTFDAISDLSITGKVIEVDSVGAVSSGVVSYSVKISFDIQDERIKSGMSVTANIITNTEQNVLLVPVSAVKSSNGTSYVEVLDGYDSSQGTTITTTNIPTKKTVEVGSSNDDYTVITSGLSEGDSIITKTTVVSSTTTKSSSSGATSASSTRSGANSLLQSSGGIMSGTAGGPPGM